MTDPRAALADMANGIDGWIHWPPELIERGLAERGVLLVSKDEYDRLRAAAADPLNAYLDYLVGGEYEGD